MSNDLLFSILPRRNSVPIVTDARIKKIHKGEGTGALGEQEQAMHSGERRVSRKEQYLKHQTHQAVEAVEEKTPEQDAEQKEQAQAKSDQHDDHVATYDKEGDPEKPEDDEDHQLDLYV